MKQPIRPDILKQLRKRARLSQSQLADKSGIPKDSLSRIERGKQSGSLAKTRKALADALKVAPEVLTGKHPLPALSDAESGLTLEGQRQQWNIRVDGAVRNAFALAALRYGIPVGRIIEVAPFLFVAAAERSLERRRTRLKVLGNALDQADAATEAFGHLPGTIASHSAAADAIEAEENSIASLDILAEQFDDSLFALYGPVKHHYDPDEDNPFVVGLREESPDPDLATIARFSRDDTEFRICPAEAKRIAAGNTDLALGILQGWAPLHEMPRDLLNEEAVEARLEWLRKKAAEHEAAMAALLAELL